jgi:catechol 2,3-dioxygenase-like lactoylglutathione lyase family enzyme
MTEERPGVWVGHIALEVAEPTRSHDFFVQAGLRTIQRSDDIAILELRGGTHLLLLPGSGTPGEAPFDLMVDDLDASHAEMTARGLSVSTITRGDIHDTFTLTDPDGHAITIRNSHVEGVV